MGAANPPLLPTYLRRSGVAFAVLALAAFFTGCGDSPNQPKTGAGFIIADGHAQQMDLVIPPAAVTGAIAPEDQTFALFTGSNSMAQVEGARAILDSSHNPAVIDYAQKLMREHARMSDDLKRIVAPRGVELPSSPTGRHADLATKLAGVAAEDRDDAFIRRFGIDAQKEAIAVSERYVKEGKDPALKRYAEQALVVLREQISLAQKLAYAAAAR